MRLSTALDGRLVWEHHQFMRRILSLLLLAGSAPLSAAPSEPPNVLLILVDDLKPAMGAD